VIIHLKSNNNFKIYIIFEKIKRDKGSFECTIFLYYILLFCIILKIVNINIICFFEILFGRFRNLETKLKKN
jgi:hypothetical protein